MEIIPTILSTYLTDFRLKLAAVAEFSKRTQIDIVDGKFAENSTVTLDEVIAETARYNQSLDIEAHLMVQYPEPYACALAKAGFKKIILHIESDGPIREILTEILMLGADCGLALSPETPVSFIEPFFDLIDNVTILSVNPGKSGQKFISSCAQKVVDVREFGAEKEIVLDGGIDEKTILEAMGVGANGVAVGSFIFEEGVPKVQYEKLKEVAG